MKIPFRYTRSQLEVFRFAFCLLSPVAVMYWIGIDTDKKLNVPGFWPDPETLNKIPKEPYEIKAELARMKKERLEKRIRLEKKIAEEYGIDIEAEKARIREQVKNERLQK
ncbi:LANO_0F03356g1_1 [Lachancea nothofagi CBS 11611]|uniref:LANO_0F03356g1_1 n=1 Tax=Lachancea nothofagi CBS 11611 TaxID=1266666 RepID=A0A1G4K740_9SACH|nr:LANO_0F03356g1_1 [Lachancea nothofagi CBS 11611]